MNTAAGKSEKKYKFSFNKFFDREPHPTISMTSSSAPTLYSSTRLYVGNLSPTVDELSLPFSLSLPKKLNNLGNVDIV
jgi:hypothetical protein